MTDLSTAGSSPPTTARQAAAYTPVGSSQTARPLQRRRGLPGSRAVVGGLLVIVAAVGVFAAYTDATSAPDTRWVVAARPIAPGTRIEARDLGVLAIELPLALQERAFVEDRATDLVGAVTLAPIQTADLIEASDVVRADPKTSARQELSFPVSTDRAVAGALQPGERVDVLATYGGEADSFTLAVVRSALLLRTSPAGDSLETGSSIVLTLGLDDPADVLAVAHAINNGKVVVARTTAAGPSRSGLERYQPERAEVPDLERIKEPGPERTEEPG